MKPNDVKTIAENLEDFIELPDGISRLRKAVLTLAVSGKLVPQDKKEGTAEELYNQIQIERLKQKKVKEFAPVTDEEIPFEIPKTWKWVRLGDVGMIVGGGTPSTSKSSYFVDPLTADSVPWLTPADMRKQTSIYISNGKQSITQDGYKHSSATLIPKGSIVFSSRAPIGYVGIANYPLSTNQGFKNFVPPDGIFPEYVYWFLLSRAEDINLRSPGTTFKEISGTAFAKEVLSLPPLAEQKRIVAKVEEVMKILDELEKEKNERDAVRTKLARSAGAMFGKENDPIFLNNLTELIKNEKDIKELERNILFLAVTGHLGTNRDEELPVENFFKQIGTVSAKKINISDNKSSVLREALPKNWTMVSLQDLGEFSSGKTPSTANHKYWNGKYPWVSSKDMKGDTISDTQDHITDLAIKDGLNLYPENTVLIVVRSGILRHTLPVLVNTVPCTINQDIKAISLFYPEMARYVQLLLKGFEEYILTNLTKKGTTVESVKFEEFSTCLFPIPPLAEQKRIVVKVGEVMGLIRKLKNTIKE